jgi:hypothetical protein
LGVDGAQLLPTSDVAYVVPEMAAVVKRSVYSNSGWLSVALETPFTVMSECKAPHVQPDPVGGHDPLTALASVTVKVPPALQRPVLGVLDVQLATISAGPLGSPMFV